MQSNTCSAPAKSGDPESLLPDTLRWSRSGLLAASPFGTGPENWLPDSKWSASGPEEAL
jgi:hypothetical protein